MLLDLKWSLISFASVPWRLFFGKASQLYAEKTQQSTLTSVGVRAGIIHGDQPSPNVKEYMGMVVNLLPEEG